MPVTSLGWGHELGHAQVGENPIFIIFGEKRGQIGKNSKKGCCGHQLGTMTHFETTQKFDLL